MDELEIATAEAAADEAIPFEPLDLLSELRSMQRFEPLTSAVRLQRSPI